jgi:hypothetical protein
VSSKKTMTMYFTVQDFALVEELACRMQTSKIDIVRRAVHLYRIVDARISAGERLYFENAAGVKTEYILL